jgi:hypothetical protein
MANLLVFISTILNLLLFYHCTGAVFLAPGSQSSGAPGKGTKTLQLHHSTRKCRTSTEGIAASSVLQLIADDPVVCNSFQAGMVVCFWIKMLEMNFAAASSSVLEY